MIDEDDDFAEIASDGDEEWGDAGDEETFGEEETSHQIDQAPMNEVDIIDSKRVREMMNETVRNMEGVINVPTSVCLKLLRAFSWNEEKLVNEFTEKGTKALLKGKGLDTLLSKPSPLKVSSFECKICCDVVTPAESFALACSHWFCNKCWTTYLTDKVDSTGVRCIMTTCPMFKCDAGVPDSTFAKFLDSAHADKFADASLKAYISAHKGLRFCPAPRCSRVIKSAPSATSVRCICGQSFCFSCDEEAHDPVSCDQVARWQAKCLKESETAQWIISNTKKCPKCKVRIEKNQGCNHMSCQFCKHEFCWVCMGPWKDHGNHTGGFYKCNKYNPHEAKNKDESKAELDRFLHYYQRFHNHDQARKFAKKQIEASEKRMATLYTQDSQTSKWQNVQFLRKSTLQVLECRRVLKYTYVYGYFCMDARERELFEFLQEELEKATERLSELSEQPLEMLNRQEVVDFTMFTQKFMNNLLNGIRKGLTKVVETR